MCWEYLNLKTLTFEVVQTNNANFADSYLL
jgi:hypothetical protein